MAVQVDKYCPKCYSDNRTVKHYIVAGRAYECKNCGKLWGWYYDRNLPKNKNKSNPDI